MEAETVRSLLLLADQTTGQGPGCGAGMARGFAAPAGAVGSLDHPPGPNCGAQLGLCWASLFLILWPEKAGFFLFLFPRPFVGSG